jgi:hypothetical protein
MMTPVFIKQVKLLEQGILTTNLWLVRFLLNKECVVEWTEILLRGLVDACNALLGFF